MNLKTTLLASLVLATPACAVTEAEMADVSEEALASRVDLDTKTFVSKDTFEIDEYVKVGPSEWKPVKVTVRYRIHFVAAQRDDYTWDGQGAMEAEAIVEAFSVTSPDKTYPVDVSYFAKRTGNGTFRLYDCDSTRRCTQDGPVSSIAFRKIDGVQVLRLSGLDDGSDHSNRGVYLEGNTKRELVFEPVPAPKPNTTIGAPIACTKGDLRAAFTPAPNGRVEVEVTDTETGTVLDHAFYGVKRHNGGTFVGKDDAAKVTVVVRGTESENVGKLSGYYGNGRLGLSLSFPRGSCDVAD